MEIDFLDIFPDKLSSLSDLSVLPEKLSRKRIAIIGGAGSIGSEVLRSIQTNVNCRVEIWDSDESRMHSLIVTFQEVNGNEVSSRLVDIRDFNSLYLAFKAFQPEVLIHAAALKHVSALELQPREAFLTNVIGTCNVIRCLELFPSESALFISTDKAANPTSVLGSTKLIGEKLWSFHANKKTDNSVYSVVRFGNVFLSRGSVVETFIAQIKSGMPITITDPEMTRFFMDVKESAQIINFLLAEKVAGLSILKMGTPIQIVDLATRIAGFYGKTPNLKLIGVKTGEKIHEELFTSEELPNVKDCGPYYNMPFPISSLSHMQIQNVPKTDREARVLIESLLDH